MYFNLAFVTPFTDMNQCTYTHTTINYEKPRKLICGSAAVSYPKAFFIMKNVLCRQSICHFGLVYLIFCVTHCCQAVADDVAWKKFIRRYYFLHNNSLNLWTLFIFGFDLSHRENWFSFFVNWMSVKGSFIRLSNTTRDEK